MNAWLRGLFALALLLALAGAGCKDEGGSERAKYLDHLHSSFQ